MPALAGQDGSDAPDPRGAHDGQRLDRDQIRRTRSLSTTAGPVALDGWTLPSFIPHNLDTLTFRFPVRDAIPGTCTIDSSRFIAESLTVWVERRYPTAPPWAPWMTEWHLVRRIYGFAGQPCTLNTARPAWHRFTARDRAGNVSCADSIYRGPR